MKRVTTMTIRPKMAQAIARGPRMPPSDGVSPAWLGAGAGSGVGFGFGVGVGVGVAGLEREDADGGLLGSMG